MPIFPQTDLKPDVAKRYRALAGPFSQTEESLFQSVLDALKGARVLTVSETRGNCRGVSIYRLRSEWISRDETRQRQRMARH